MIKERYVVKQPDSSGDYKAAYDIVDTLAIGNSITHSPLNNKRFRKYLYDLSLKQDREFATRKRNDSTLYITRLS